MSAISLLLAQNDTGVFVAGGAMFMVFMAVALIASIFWIWMLIDVLTSALPTGEKVLWFLVVFFLHLIGAIIYYVVGRPGRAAPQM